MCVTEQKSRQKRSKTMAESSWFFDEKMTGRKLRGLDGNHIKNVFWRLHFALIWLYVVRD